MQQQGKHEILVFGATGGTGVAIVRGALARGFSVAVFMRDGSRARDVFSDLVSRLTIFEGDAASESDVRHAVGPNLDAVICSLGIYQRRSGSDDLAQATAHIITAMQASGTRRLICISSLGVGDSRGQGDFATRLIQKTALRHTLADKELQEQAIRASDLDWTVLRPTRLLSDGGPPYSQSWIGKQPAYKIPWAINRTQVAERTLDCLDDPQTINKALNITGALTRPQSTG